MQTLAAQLADARQALAPIAGENAGLEARLLAQAAWGLTPEALVRDADQPYNPEAFTALLQRRMQSEPVAQIMGEKYFWNAIFTVTSDVLTPRADSETLIEELVRQRPDRSAPLRILDLGTGSGCLLLSALSEYPNAQGTGVDQSEAALTIAQKNAAAQKVSERTQFVRSNWLSKVDGSFDIVLANPPYIATGDIAGLDADVRDFEPHAALDGGADGLDCYRAIVEQVMAHLAPGALLLFEVGMGQAEDVATLAQSQGLKLVRITPDLAGISRVVALTTHTN